MRVATSIVAGLCARFGGALKVPEGIVGAQLLWALAGNESSFGVDCAPRHERSYCRGGKYFNPELTSLWGCLAHCSFSPWQVMYPNISRGGGVDPVDAMRRPDIGAFAAVDFLNRVIFGKEKATTIEQVADAFNSGDWRDDNKPAGYIAELVKNYGVEMPPFDARAAS